jgi:hypothetical protein
MPFTRTVMKYDAFLSTNEGRPRARLVLSCSDCVLTLVFSDPIGSGAPPPSNTFDAASKTGSAFMPLSQYTNYIDLLRNEKPIWVNFITEGAIPSFEIYCQSEPTGEGE